MCNKISRRHLLRTAGCTLAGATLLSANPFAQRNLWAHAYAQTLQADEPLHLCIDQSVDDAIGAANLQLVGSKSRFWPTGSTLRVRFLNGDPIVRKRVEEVAHEWSQYANIKFEFGDTYPSDIRIAFFPGGGSSSFIGTVARSTLPYQATMSFGWLYPNTSLDEYRRVVLHEFGHALGLLHEHQSPAGNIAWNKEAVYAYYGGSPNYWSKWMVDSNIFDRYDAPSTQYSQLDPASIMMYPIPKSLTLDGFSTDWNDELSATDKAYIGKWYPFTPQPIYQLACDPFNGDQDEVKQAIGQPGETDTFVFEANRKARYTLETKGATDLVMALFGPNDDSLFICENDDGGEQGNARISRVLSPGAYALRVRHFSPNQTGDYTLLLRRERTE